jgi:hypothetical protein
VKRRWSHDNYHAIIGHRDQNANISLGDCHGLRYLSFICIHYFQGDPFMTRRNSGLAPRHPDQLSTAQEENATVSDGRKFTPTDKTRAVLKELAAGLADTAEEKFFEVWEAEISDPDAPRMAGSVIAAAYMRHAARFAIFGAECAGREPSLDLWLAMAKENFIDAQKDVLKSIAIADREPRTAAGSLD